MNAEGTPPGYGRGFIMFNRSPETDELLRDPLAFALLAQIARRARWRTAFSSDGLEIGEALIGDHKSLRMTRAEYRTRVDRLQKWRQITTRTTNKGTIAKLVSTLVFDINAPDASHRDNQPHRQQVAIKSPMNNQRTNNESPLTNKVKGNNEKNEKPSTLIYRMTEQNKAIESQIEAIKADKRNFERLPGEFQDTLKPEFRKKVKELTDKKKANVARIASL